MSYALYLDAEREINEGLIRLGLSLERPEGYSRDPLARMREMERFLAECGDPQRGLPAIHVAGTSGKGSVAAAIAGALREAGLRVGLHVSPYLQSATEKIWVDGLFASAERFADLVRWVAPAAAPRVHPETPASIHGMASVAIALEGFRRETVDAIVFEAGCGGRYDLTSFVETRVAVVTNVGRDHLVSLGPDLERVAWHKAGIARPGVPLVTGAEGRPLEVVREEARSVGARVEIVPPSGDAWEHNRAVAYEAARLAARDLGAPMDEEIFRRGAGRTRLAGRAEVAPGPGPRTVLDGAHNAEKLAVAVESTLSGAGPGPRVALVGFLGTKAGEDLAAPLSGRFDRVVTTEPRVYGKTPLPAEDAARLLARAGFEPLVVPDPRRALDEASRLAGGEGTLLVTGSFYLVGDLRDRWFPKERVVLERTSWPQPSPTGRPK